MATALRALAFLLFAAFAACSGGSSSFSFTGSTSNLFLDGAAGIDAEIAGRLASVRLEALDGTASGELLAAETDVALARMDGSGSLIALRGIPDGAFAALVLRFADGSMRVRLGDAREGALAARDHFLRVPFANPWLATGRRSCLALRHTASVTPLAIGAGVMEWSPSVVAAPIDVAPIRFGRVDVLRVDVAAESAVGLLVGMDARQITLAFAPDALLLREPSITPLDRASFLAGLLPGSRLVVDGVLDLDDRLTVTAALDLGVNEAHGRGEKGELRARILELVPGREAFRAVLLDVEKGAHLLPDPRPRTLVVDASPARIKWSPRRGRHGGHLPFSALEPGMIVTIEWHGAMTGEALAAEKIDIREQGTCLGRDFAGEVLAVSFDPRTLSLRLREVVVIDGRELREIEFAVDEDTPIVRTNGSAVRLVRLAEIEVGERANVLADPRGRGRLRAELVVLGWR
ncbi:MAG: hypothetical protein HZB39_03175 [Planctomycetes bacterium]|nr:hypothetical protein [Planctomycetota bacterium]